MLRFCCIVLLLAVVVAGAGCGSSGTFAATATGQVTNPNKTTSTFTLSSLTKWTGFTPSNNSVNVKTTSATVFLDRNGNLMSGSQWYDYVAANLSPSTITEAIGVFDSGVLTATSVQLK